MNLFIRCCFLVLLCFSSVRALELEAPEIKIPEKESAAAAEKWKIEKLAERLRVRGAAGQHDVFWELLALYEKQPEARGDANLEAVMDWLLFKAGLSTDQATIEPTYTKLPALNANLGARLLEKRLNDWIAGVGMHATGSEPWSWAEFRKIDMKALSAAVRKVQAAGPKHNPLPRLWLALLLVACDDPNAAKELAEARANVEKNYALQGESICNQAIAAIVGSGVKSALPLLADLADGGLNLRPEEGAYNAPLSTLMQLLGWNTETRVWSRASNPNSNPKSDMKSELARLREWLKTNMASLTWNPALRRYTSDAPPPGMEALYAAGKVVEARWNFKCIERFTRGAYENNNIVKDLLALMEKNPDAAKDPETGNLLVALLDTSREGWYYGDGRTNLLVRVPKINADLGAKLWAGALRKSIQQNPMSGFDNLARQVQDADPAAIRGGCELLMAEYQAAKETAKKSGDIEAALNAEMTFISLGGKSDKKQLNELLDKAPAEWTTGKYNAKLNQWSQSLIRAGRTGGLRLLLVAASRDLASYSSKRNEHPLRTFQTVCGWIDYNDPPPQGTAGEILARSEEWLDKNESVLKYDTQTSKFTGALSPERAALAAVLEKIPAKFGLNPGGAAAGKRDAARRFFSELIALMESNTEAAKEPACGEAVLALIEPAQLLQDQVLTKKLLINFVKVSRDSGAKAWAAYLRSSLANSIANGFMYDMVNLERKFPGFDQRVYIESRALVLPDMKKQFETPEVGKPDETMRRALAYIYAGGPLEMPALEKLLAEAEKLGDLRRLQLIEWGESIARAENITGLKLLLYAAKLTPDNRYHALSRFEYMAGLIETENVNFNGNLDAVLDADAAWLKENEKSLKWNAVQKRFVGPPRQPAEAATPGSPVKPPKPPPQDIKEF